MHSKTIIKLECDMEPVIEAMEERGLNVNLSKLQELTEITAQEKLLIDTKLKMLLDVGENVNFNSSRDVSKLLKSHFGIKPTTTSTGRFSTSRRILKGLHNPVTDEIIRFRDLEKLLSSLKAIRNATDKDDGKIYCTYVDTCPSGRLYTKSYSFQSIPEVAREVIYPDKGCSFVLADYDSFELRILSALAHDKYFKDCWDRGLDLHRKVVSDMKAIPYEDVTDKQRKLGKALNFGLSYGQEAVGLARVLHVSTEQAQELMDTYKSKIPEIEEFKLDIITKARQLGYCETHFGRKRLLPGLLSPNTSVRKKAERRVVNTMIQGTGADIVKFSLVNLHNAGFSIDTMLHDGILLTVFDNEIDLSMRRIKEIMEVTISGVVFPVSQKTGKTWKECYGKGEA